MNLMYNANSSDPSFNFQLDRENKVEGWREDIHGNVTWSTITKTTDMIQIQSS